MRIPVTDWLTTEKLTLLRGWARDGLTDQQIARKIGISVRTLDNWKHHVVYQDNGTVCPIAKALKDGKEVVDYAVENALLKNAMNGDTTAIIFWLKNRQPDKWRDRRNDQKDQKPEQDIEDLRPLVELLNEPDSDD